METKNLYCHRCGAELEIIENCEINEGGRGNYYRFYCPNCGAMYEVEEPDSEEKENYEFWKDPDISERVGSEGDHVNNDICINCGHKVYVGNNFMMSDCTGEDLPEDEDKMNYCLNTCQHCGVTETRWDNSENEKKNLPYWADDVWLKTHLENYYLPYLINIWQKANNATDEELVCELDKIISYHK